MEEFNNEVQNSAPQPEAPQAAPQEAPQAAPQPEVPQATYQAAPQPAPQAAVIPGKGKAIASLVLGIVSIVLWFFGATAIGSVVAGIVGVILASSSKKDGFEGPIRTAGFICSLIGLILGAIIFVACVACVGAAGTAGLLSNLRF